MEFESKPSTPLIKRPWKIPSNESNVSVEKSEAVQTFSEHGKEENPLNKSPEPLLTYEIPLELREYTLMDELLSILIVSQSMLNNKAHTIWTI